jgi:RNA polymerase sigma factor (sigma-70 family)
MTREIGIEVRQIGRDPDAFAAFYRAHLQAVQGFVARRVSDPHLAADLTADVFIAAIESADRYRPERGVPEAWLMGVARNVVNAEFRRASKHRAVTRRICARELLDSDALADIEHRIDAERAAREVYQAVSRLPRHDRALVELVAVDGLAVNEAARRLGISEGAARVRWHRSRTRIKSQITTPVAL